MDRTTYSPRITHLSWGRLETEDGAFKDARLFPVAPKSGTGTRPAPATIPAYSRPTWSDCWSAAPP